MLGLDRRIERNPLKYYLGLFLVLSIFFICLFFIIFGIVFTSYENQINSAVTSTNISMISSFFYETTPNSHINFENIVALIAIIGAFGVFFFVFYSIQDGSISKEENKFYYYGFLAVLSITILLDAYFLNPAMTIKFPSQNLFEFITGLFFFILTLVIAIFFKSINNKIKYNYDNRIALINFLKNSNTRTVFSNFWDNISRLLISGSELLSLFVFFSILLMPIFEFLIVKFNVLSIISTDLMILLLFNAYSQLVFLREPYLNVELIKSYPFSWFSSTWIYSPSRSLLKVFIIDESDEDITILNKNNKEMIIIKNCICSLRYNNYEIFENYKSLPKFLKILIRFALALISSFIILLVILSLVANNWYIFLISFALGFSLFFWWFPSKIDCLLEKAYTIFTSP